MGGASILCRDWVITVVQNVGCSDMASIDSNIDFDVYGICWFHWDELKTEKQMWIWGSTYMRFYLKVKVKIFENIG